MTFTSLRHLLVAAAIVVFGHLCASDVRCQIDRDTQRHGMHSCPPGQFVIGVHVRQNLLLCSQSFGTYDLDDEIIDSGGDGSRGTQVRGMHACPDGMAITGLHVRDNKFLCAPVERATPRYVDASNNSQVEGVSIHTCPRDPVSGIHVSRNLLLCGTRGAGAQIDRLGPTPCVDRGGTVTIYGSGFGAQGDRFVELGGHGIGILLHVTSWSDTQITV
ncbi:MAG: hypothetical protein ACXWID_14435, partial [Pyrinomonadaceae bacterium]